MRVAIYGRVSTSHQVEHQTSRDALFKEAAFEVRSHPQGRGMHQGVKLARFGLFARERLSPAGRCERSNAIDISSGD